MKKQVIAVAATKFISPERLFSLLKVCLRLTAERDLDQLLRMIMEETTLVTEAERSSLFLINREKNEMWAKIAQGVNVIDIRFPLGAGIAGLVGRTGEAVNVADAYRDVRFNPEFDLKTGFRTKSILCVPVKNMQGDIIGVIQVLNKKAGTFTGEDKMILAALASQTAVAIENADLYRRLNVLNLSLEQKVTERTAELTETNRRLAELHRTFDDISITDTQTGAYNRRYFVERVKQETKRVTRYGPPVSLLMIDIDFFKKVNDGYGLHAGDAVLAGIARLIKGRLRTTDLLARYGGEEFSLLATGTDQAGALGLAKRLRELVQNAAFEHGGRTISVTVSIGVGTWDASLKEDFEGLIRSADAALTRAKEQGRNRVSI
jgi:diguanylate cyclase (GGDEF)-like protein